MIVMDLTLNNIFGFNDFHINFSYPKKIVNSMIQDEHLAGRLNFRYKKAVILMGANATGKTSLGKALLRIFKFMGSGNTALLMEMAVPNTKGSFSIDFVTNALVLHRLSGVIDTENDNVVLRYWHTEIGEKDTYEKCAARLSEQSEDIGTEPKILKKYFREPSFRFSYPEIESTLNVAGVNRDVLLRTLRAVIGTLDPTLTDVSISKDLRDSFIIRRKGTEIIIQDGKLLNREMLSSGTAEGVDVAIFLAAILSGPKSFYYCDEHFSYIQTDIEKRIFGIMLDNLKENEQLIFTTHNTDMLDLNLPKHSYAFLRKQICDGESHVSVIYASDILKRNTDSIRHAAENDVFSSLPDDSMLDMLEKGWLDEK
ncbi:MAG: ATP-binding protein [Lachnospiraceae bacterium]|nr:ATP-binding protein [Lachnospiraceae bacterium]